jgi:hypothetical protein
VLEETSESALETFSNVSVSCAQNGQIVIAISTQKVALRYTGTHEMLSREVVFRSFGSVFTDETGALILAPFAGPALIVKVQDDKCGVPVYRAVAATSDIRFAARTGRLVVPDPRNGSIISLQSAPEKVAVYSQSGALLLTKSVHDNLCVSNAVVVGDPPPVCTYEGYDLFPLGRDLYIAKVLLNGNTWEYQVLDMDFNVVGHISSPAIGMLAAADGDGNVYGWNTQCQGCEGGAWSSDGVPQLQIIRAHLAKEF